jgi:hypothetical protein
MLALIPLLCLLVGNVEAKGYNRQLKYGRRESLNETLYPNSTTTTTEPTLPIASTSTTTSTPAFNSTSPNIPSEELPKTPPTSPSLPGNETTGDQCVGSVTYYGSVPPTVYLTVTEEFSVTVTASNASITASETFITPPPACISTILPLPGTFQPLETIELSSAVISSQAGLSPSGKKPPPQPHVDTGTANSPHHTPPPAEESPPDEETSTVLKSTVYATAPYTSTVIITKKTPVVVVSSQTSAPPVFQDPGAGQNPPPPPPPSPTGGSSPPNAPSNDKPPPASPGSVAPAPVTATPSLGGAIISILRTQIPAPSATPPAQTTLANVPVAFAPSSVIIGSSAIAIPSSGQVVATIQGQTFTVGPSGIAVAGTTIGGGPLNVIQSPPVSIFSTRVTVAPGVVAEVVGSTAVIDGSTFRIGFGAPATTLTFNGVPVDIGPYGIILPTSTIAANAMTDTPKVVESAGGLVFSIDQSEVVIAGTTYQIGSGAPTVTTVIDGQTVSIGAGGVGLKSTTLKPTTASPRTGSGATDSAPATSPTVAGNSGARSMDYTMNNKKMLAWALIALGGHLLF